MNLGEEQFNVEDSVAVTKSLTIGYLSKGEGDIVDIHIFDIIKIYNFDMKNISSTNTNTYIDKSIPGVVRKTPVGEKPFFNESKSKPFKSPHPHN